MEKHPVAAPLNEGENGEVLEHLFVLLISVASSYREKEGRREKKTNELGIGKISTSLPPSPISQPDKPYPFQRPDFRELRFSDSIPPPCKDYLFTDILRVGALTIGNKLHGEHGETETAASYFSGTRITARLKRINPFRFRVASKNGEEGQDRIRVTKDCIESLPTSPGCRST